MLWWVRYFLELLGEWERINVRHQLYDDHNRRFEFAINCKERWMKEGFIGDFLDALEDSIKYGIGAPIIVLIGIALSPIWLPVFIYRKIREG